MKIDLDDNFEDCMRTIWPDVAKTSIQYRESRKVWFATISWMMARMLKVAELPEAEAEAVLEDWTKQLEEFQKEMKTTYKEDFQP